jgi:hypothetical protein
MSDGMPTGPLIPFSAAMCLTPGPNVSGEFRIQKLHQQAKVSSVVFEFELPTACMPSR